MSRKNHSHTNVVHWLLKKTQGESNFLGKPYLPQMCVMYLWYFSQCWSELLRFLINSEVWTLNWKGNELPSCMIQNGAWQSILYWIGTWSPSQIIQNLAWQSLWSQTRSKFIWSEIDEKPDKGGGRIALSAPTQARSASPDKNQIQTSLNFTS